MKIAFHLPLSIAPYATPFKNMTAPSIATCTDRGIMAVAENLERHGERERHRERGGEGDGEGEGRGEGEEKEHKG